MTAPRPARRRVLTEDEPAASAGRRGCVFVGAMLGIAAGALLAVFVVPPLINHYFGTADVAFGEPYTSDGRRLRVAEVRTSAAGDAFEVLLEATAAGAWSPAPGDFELELEGGKRVALLPPDPAVADTSLLFAPAAPRVVLLRFAIPAGGGTPKTLNLDDPRARFALAGGAR